MSGGALFSNNTTRGASKYLVEFKAGKMTMKGRMVHPDSRKGQLYVHQSDDSLMHFCWKDRTTGVVEDDLIIFPDDCEFKHVPQCKTGRVYLLRFKLSSRKFFFWLQEPKTDKDDEYCRKINEVLNNPPTPGSQRSGGANHEGDLQNLLNNMSQQQLIQLFGGVGQIGGLGSLLGTMNRVHVTRNSTTTSSSTPVTTTATRPPAAQTPAPTTVTETPRTAGVPKTQSARTATPTNLLGITPTNNTIHLSDLQSFLSALPAPAPAETVVQRGIASELTKSIPAAVITSMENLEYLRTHLLPTDDLCTTLSSPQFSQALSMFWSALQSGQAGPVVRQFGMGTDAVNAAATGNLEEFVTALETEAKSTTSQGSGAAQQQQGSTQPQSEEDKSKKQAPSGGASGGASGKKDDDDEGMALD